LERIVITGWNGFIGRHLVKKLLSCHPSSLILISNTTPNMTDTAEKILTDENLRNGTDVISYTADIRDTNAISKIFQKEKPDTCIHLAAKISVVDSIKNPKETMDINVNGTLNILETSYKNKVNKFVFASSAAVYGDPKNLPISENQALEPLSPYGVSKMLAEQHVSSYNKSEKIQNTISLRIFNVYGNAQGRSSQRDVITSFLERLSKGLPPIIYGDGTRTRDFISIDDVIDGLILSTMTVDKLQNSNSKDKLTQSIFNLGTGKPTSMIELAQTMIKISNFDLQPLYIEQTGDSREIKHSYADMTKSKGELHFVAKKELKTGLQELIDPILVRK